MRSMVEAAVAHQIDSSSGRSKGGGSNHGNGASNIHESGWKVINVNDLQMYRPSNKPIHFVCSL